jgi:hypothetical protein
MSILFRTSTREYRGENAVGLLSAIRGDAVAARRPGNAFLHCWLSDFDADVARRATSPDGEAEARALEILFLCHEYGLGFLSQGDSTRSSAAGGDSSPGAASPVLVTQRGLTKCIS